MEINLIISLQSVSSNFLLFFCSMISYLSSWVGFVFLLVCFFMFTKWTFAASFGITYGSGVLLSTILKSIINRPRPFIASSEVLNLLPTTSASMPSGHCISGAILLTFLFYVVMKNIKHKSLRISLYVVLIFAMISLMFARQYLGQHYLSDTIVGTILGILVAIVGIIIHNKLTKKTSSIEGVKNEL